MVGRAARCGTRALGLGLDRFALVIAGLDPPTRAEAGLRSAGMLGMCLAAPAIFRSADASDKGRRLISAPSRSASYSRFRLIAICTSAAARGPRITSMSVPTIPIWPLLLPRPK